MENYDITFITEISDRYCANIDVFVNFHDSGRKYVCTFYTIANIVALMEKQRVEGDALDGLYYSDPSWIIVRELTEEVINRVIADLLKYGMQTFEKVFEQAY